MTSTFYIADPHFFHENEALRRGYSSAAEMNDHIIGEWVSLVRPKDLVRVLGDISGNDRSEFQALTILESLPGRKELISGNHDSISGVHSKHSKNFQKFHEVFERVNDVRSINIEKRRVMLSHYPFASQGDGVGRVGSRHELFRVPDNGEALLIHGHTHHSHPQVEARQAESTALVGMLTRHW